MSNTTPNPSINDAASEFDVDHFHPAGLLRRLAALVYDTLVLAGISLVYGMIGFALKEIIFGATPDGVRPKGGPLLFLGWMAILIGFYIYFWYRGGQTVGMRAWRLRIVAANANSDKHKPTILNLLIRCGAAIMSFVFLGLGYFWCLIDKNNETLHDKVSKTRIVILPKPGEC